MSSGVILTWVVQDNVRCAKFFQVCKLTLGAQYNIRCSNLHFLFLGVQRNIGCANQHWVCKSTLGVRHLNNYNITRFNNIILLSNN